MSNRFSQFFKKFRNWPLSTQMITITIPIFTILVIISISQYPNFSFIEHHMSALGNSTKNPQGFIHFVVACIITGVLLVPYFYGLKRWRTDDKVLNISLYVIIGIGFIACFGIIMQAIYRSGFSLHTFYSAIHWVGDALLLMVTPIPMLRHKKFYKPIILVGLVATVFNVYYIVTFAQDPWVEWITAVSSLLFAALIAYNMIKENI